MSPIPPWLWKTDEERRYALKECCPRGLKENAELAKLVTEELEHDRSAGIAAEYLHDKFTENEPPDVDVLRKLMNALSTYIDERRDQHVRAMQKDEGSSLELPGLGVPINDWPEEDDFFPVLSANAHGEEGFKAVTLTIREACMLKVMEDLTNKPEWWKKIHDPEIQAKWQKEMVSMDWARYRAHGDFTTAMAENVIDELRRKSKVYEAHGLVPVMDYSMAAVKSDCIMTAAMVAALKDAISSLEHVSEHEKDWHPGSNGQVLDIVHPSLWPLVYGKSRVLLNERVGVADAMSHCGTGHILPAHLEIQAPDEGNFSMRYQWLPCDVAISADGTAKIESYINNVHPTRNADLYPVIEQFIQKSLPAWELVYRWEHDNELQRIVTDNAIPKCPDDGNCPYDCDPWNRPLGPNEPEREEDEQDDDGYDVSERGKLDEEWFLRTHPVEVPDPTPCASNMDPSDIKTQGFFEGAERIQVIVKLANIHLTPDSPTYAGGSWHIEGLENEHICATALFYYDSQNITDSYLDFRTRADKEDLATELDHAQGDTRSIGRVFSMQPVFGPTQDIGSVLTREGRALFFPNVYQHHVSPFQLADPSKPGHRKILALFLVDPKIPIISTAQVPPQRRDWWLEETKLELSETLHRLPQELMNMVRTELDFPIGREEAEKIRDDLMAERSSNVEGLNRDFLNLEFNFCEH